jgi:hypothetical protein
VPIFAAWPAALRRAGSPATLVKTANLIQAFHLDHSAGVDQF